MKKIIIHQNILSELNVSDKNLQRFIDTGNNQYVFDGGDKVIKFAKPYSADEKTFENRRYRKEELYEFKVMQDNPKYFPKIYKITERYVIMEKLDVKQAQRDYELLMNKTNNKFTDFLDTIQNCVGDFQCWYPDYKDLYISFANNPIFVKFYRYISNICKLKLITFDIHSKNFGYDKQGNLKLIDV